MSSTISTLLQAKRRIGQAMIADRLKLRRRFDSLEKEYRSLILLDPGQRDISDGPIPGVLSGAISQTGQKPDILPPRALRTPGPNISKISDSRQRSFNEQAEKLLADLEKSVQQAETRRKRRPEIHYDPELPINQKRQEIAKLISENQVVIVCGETGSGKSTQLPKICLELGRGIYGTIGHTQPRRIAARSVATRIAEELSVPLGQQVGYKVRFTDQTGPDTLVKLMTDGILLAESQNDRFFDQYDTIIIDEAHERSLNIDFLLGIMKRVLSRRRDLKLIITSATIDAKRFAAHFATLKGPAPIIEVSGRTYPIDIFYYPVDERERLPDRDFQEDTGEYGAVSEKENAVRDLRNSRKSEKNGTKKRKQTQSEPEEDAFERTFFEAMDELASLPRGDILVFMPTERDIFETAKLLKHHSLPGDDATRKTEILPLYARLSAAEQQKIFKKSSWRRIVIATNVAESSLTVPGIRYVLDPGTARISRYSARSRTQRLPIEPVSQASANQRSGRCGRVGPGICIRLYSEDDFKARPEYTTPEIQRTNLATVILQTKILNLGAVERFPFIDPPRPAAIADGYRTLFELGAIDSERNLTELGKKLSRLPVDPRIGRMILAANEENCLREMLIIASVLEIQDPRERPHDQQEKADQKHLSFLDEESDFLAYLKIWDFWQELKDKLSSSQLRKACRENFLSFNRMREWSDIHLQLLQIVHQEKMRLRPRQENNYDAIHRAILTGLLYGIARKTDDSTDYKVTGDTRFSVWPGSGLFHKKTEWLVASERVETSRRYLRTVARINPDWIESLAAHLLERTFREPHWIRETGCVHAYERVSLYGLTIIPKRRINYGPVNPKEARDLFIQQALVEEEFDCDLDFFVKNRELRQEAKRLQDKLRRHDFLHGQSAIREFYQDRIPEDVYDAVSLKKWYKRLSGVEKQKLCMRLSDICQGDIDETTKKLFPDKIPTFEGTDISLEYRFHPGEEDDGLAAVVPAEGLRQLEEKRLGWLVPGLMEQKIVALLKTLPKEIRRELVPIPDTAAEMVRDIPYGEGGMEEVVAREVSRRVGRLVTASDFDLERLPSELLMKIKVIDGKGKLIAESRELPKLREKLGIEVSRTLATAHSPKWNRDGLTRWDFGSLPESVILTRNDVKLRAYPALCDPRMLPEFQEDSPTRLNAGQVKSLHETVSLRLLDSPELAQKTSRYGLLRLFYLSAKRDFLSQADWLPNRERYQMYTAQIPGFSFRTACGELIAARALDTENSPFPKNEGDFNRLVAKGKSQIGAAVSDVTHWITQFAQQFQQARLAIEKHRKGAIGEVARDAEVGLFQLLPPFFYLTTPWNWLKEFPRYFKAIPIRLEKWKSGGADADYDFAMELAEYQERYEEKRKRHQDAGILDPELETFRWMLEEYRVSLFAQQLGTAVKVSAVRLEKQWQKVIQ